jgi:hypothetical protein
MAASGQALIGRIYKLTIATPVATPNNFKDTTSEVIEITDMRIQFSITKTLKKEPNTGEIRITNLSPSRRASLQKKGVKVRLEVGYKDTGLTQIFSGDVRTIDHVRMGADWETVMQLGDGERAWQFARVNESFAPGTPKSEVVRRLADSLGVDAGNVAKQIADITGTFDQGFAASGSASRAFDQVIRAVDLEWSMQDGALQLLRPDQALDATVPDITPTSGLIGSPEMGTPPTKGKPALVKFDALLTPVKPGSKVKLKSDRYDGYVKVVGVEFTGDTRGGAWYSKIAGEVLK